MYKTMIFSALLFVCTFISCSDNTDYSDNPDMPHFVYLYAPSTTAVSIADILDSGAQEASFEVMLRYGISGDKTATVDAVVEPDFSLVEVYNRTNSKEFIPFPSANLSWTSAQVKITAGSLETGVPFKLTNLDNLSDAKFLLPITIKSATASNGFAVSEKKKTVYYEISQEGAKAFKLTAAKPCVIPARDFDLGGEGVGYHDNDPGSAPYREQTYGEKDCGVDIQGDYVAYTAGGEWLMYTVRVVNEGDYAVDFEIATGWGGSIALDVDGKAATERLDLKVEGNWNLFWYYEKYQTPAQPVLTLSKGVHKIKFREESDGFNIRSLKFTKK